MAFEGIKKEEEDSASLRLFDFNVDLMWCPTLIQWSENFIIVISGFS